MENIKGVIFDLDGTLVHTDHYKIHQAVISTTAYLGGNYIRGTDLSLWYGPDRSAVIRSYGLDPTKFWETWDDLYGLDAVANSAGVFKDVLPSLDELKQMGKKFGMVTACPTEKAFVKIRMLGEDRFESIKIANPYEGLPGKPDPTSLLECIEEMSLTPEEVMYWGNGPEDIFMSRNANVFVGHVDRGYYRYSDMPEADVVHKNMYDLVDFLS